MFGGEKSPCGSGKNNSGLVGGKQHLFGGKKSPCGSGKNNSGLFPINFPITFQASIIKNISGPHTFFIWYIFKFIAPSNVSETVTKSVIFGFVPWAWGDFPRGAGVGAKRGF